MPPVATCLSRDLLETGALDTLLAQDAPGLRLLSDEERLRSLRETLACRPAGDVWLFAYGSLIWNPTVRHAERRVARIEGWHREFSLSSRAGRGSPENPGLVLALEQGGWCDGLALRINEAEAEHELAILWRREMAMAAYIPRWIEIRDRDQAPIGRALAFTADWSAPSHAGDLAPEDVVRRLATASGSLGTSAEYLFQTRDGLRASGIQDAGLESLARQVEHDMELMDRREASGRVSGSESTC